jgi:hypothetical protein
VTDFKLGEAIRKSLKLGKTRHDTVRRKNKAKARRFEKSMSACACLHCQYAQVKKEAGKRKVSFKSRPPTFEGIGSAAHSLEDWEPRYHD